MPTRGKFVFSFGQAMHLTLQKLFELVKQKRSLGQTGLFGDKGADKLPPGADQPLAERLGGKS